MGEALTNPEEVNREIRKKLKSIYLTWGEIWDKIVPIVK